MARQINLTKRFLQAFYVSRPASPYKRLGHYGIIGNMETAALIGVDGSIDWLCLPHLESPSVFGRLLDSAKGGYFAIHPRTKYTSHQAYIPQTNILETIFKTKTGTAVVTDFMPPFKKRTIWHKNHVIFRKVECRSGFVDLHVDFAPRFNYGRRLPRLETTDYGIVASVGAEKLYLDSRQQFAFKRGEAEAAFTLHADEERWFTLQYNTRSNFNAAQRRREFRETIRFWHRWAHTCNPKTCVFGGPWHDLVVRSGLVLKLLSHGETGAIAAAATTSLPETIGGVRNWDYRFNWIRDSVFTVQALYALGHLKEARELFNWYKKLYSGVKATEIQIMYTLHGERDIAEKSLRHLAGYKNSRPVRIGNAAAKQRQLDIYGEVLEAAYATSQYGETISKNDWRLLKKIVNHTCRVWRQKDYGIWEVRGGPRHFVYSKVMCWVAIDRGIKIAEKREFKAPLEYWQQVRDEIKEAILAKGFSKKLNSFVQSFDSENLDAANLLIPIIGFLPIDDRRVQGTINATLKKLTQHGLVYRYRSRDGLPGQEGAFVLATCWLIDVLALSGRVKQAEKIFINLLKYISPLGLFAEELDPVKKIQLGNYPQAFSHVGLINSALYIGLAKGKAVPGLTPLGVLKKSLVTTLNLFNFPINYKKIPHESKDP